MQKADEGARLPLCAHPLGHLSKKLCMRAERTSCLCSCRVPASRSRSLSSAGSRGSPELSECSAESGDSPEGALAQAGPGSVSGPGTQAAPAPAAAGSGGPPAAIPNPQAAPAGAHAPLPVAHSHSQAAAAACATGSGAPLVAPPGLQAAAAAGAAGTGAVPAAASPPLPVAVPVPPGSDGRRAGPASPALRARARASAGRAPAGQAVSAAEPHSLSGVATAPFGVAPAAEAACGGAVLEGAQKQFAKHFGAGLEVGGGGLWPSQQSEALEGQRKADAAPSAAAASSLGAGKDALCPELARAHPPAASAEWPGWGPAEVGKPHHGVVSCTGAALVAAQQQQNTRGGCCRCTMKVWLPPGPASRIGNVKIAASRAVDMLRHGMAAAGDKEWPEPSQQAAERQAGGPTD